MTPLPECFGIIPARFQSKRFPGKPLADLHGKPMFWHVYNQARKCPHLSRIVLATAVPVTDVEQPTIGLVVAVKDITDRPQHGAFTGAAGWSCIGLVTTRETATITAKPFLDRAGERRRRFHRQISSTSQPALTISNSTVEVIAATQLVSTCTS